MCCHPYKSIHLPQEEKLEHRPEHLPVPTPTRSLVKDVPEQPLAPVQVPPESQAPEELPQPGQSLPPKIDSTTVAGGGGGGDAVAPTPEPSTPAIQHAETNDTKNQQPETRKAIVCFLKPCRSWISRTLDVEYFSDTELFSNQYRKKSNVAFNQEVGTLRHMLSSRCDAGEVA